MAVCAQLRTDGIVPRVGMEWGAVVSGGSQGSVFGAACVMLMVVCGTDCSSWWRWCGDSGKMLFTACERALVELPNCIYKSF